ncbi:MAG: hypothetical protein RIT28_2695 [Pseudomonadota bacterium]|jgi:hypothetical protein
MNAADWFRKTLKGRVQRALATSPRLRALRRALRRLAGDADPPAATPSNPSPKRRAP